MLTVGASWTKNNTGTSTRAATWLGARSLSEDSIFGGCWKMFIPSARDEILRNEPRLKSGRSDDQPSPRLRPDKSARQENEDNPDRIGTDGRFPTAS